MNIKELNQGKLYEDIGDRASRKEIPP